MISTDSFDGKSNLTILDAEDVARILGCNKETIYRMARSGKIPHFHVGARIKFSLEQIEKWVKGN